MNNPLIYIKSSEIKKIREQILHDQQNRCCICNDQILDISKCSLDHQHKTSKQELGVDGAGLVRGVLCNSCNLMEGKIYNNMSRFVQPQSINDRVIWLENLVQYYKKGTYNIVHPSEKPKADVVSKRNYNKLKKVYAGKKKFPEYPKSGKLNLALKTIFEEYDINPYN